MSLAIKKKKKKKKKFICRFANATLKLPIDIEEVQLEIMVTKYRLLLFSIVEQPQQWSYFFSYLASQKTTLSILPTHFTKHLAAVGLF